MIRLHSPEARELLGERYTEVLTGMEVISQIVELETEHRATDANAFDIADPILRRFVGNLNRSAWADFFYWLEQQRV